MATSTKYIVLLRGINVGGNNLISMADLKTCLAGIGFEDVLTHGNSGNAIFRSAKTGIPGLTTVIEHALKATFDLPLRVVVKSQAQLAAIIADAPKTFGSDPATYREDVVFLKPPLTPTKAMEAVRTKEDVDTAAQGGDAIYFSRLKSKAGKSYLPKLASTPEYQSMTIRTYGTVVKISQLMERDS